MVPRRSTAQSQSHSASQITLEHWIEKLEEEERKNPNLIGRHIAAWWLYKSL